MACVNCLQVRERCPSLVRECHAFLPLLEEMEKHMTAFYQALERASRITSAAGEADTQTQSQQKQKWQVRYEDKGLILAVSALHHGYINMLSYLFPQFP